MGIKLSKPFGRAAWTSAETSARITDLNGRSITDEPCARHTLQLIPQGFFLALVDFSAGRRGPERATSSLAELTT